MAYIRSEIGEEVAEVLYGARRKDEWVVEGGVSETLWCRRHDVLERSVTVVKETVVLCSQTVTANKHTIYK